VRATTLAAYAQQDLPFERLVEALQPVRDLSRSPLFQVMLVLQNAPAATLELPGVTLHPLAVTSGTAKFELSLALSESADGLSGMLEYNTDLFDRSTMERLLDHFHTLLAAIVAQPDLPIAALPLLTAAERSTFDLWNAATLPYPSNRSMHQLVEQQVVQSPDRVAVIDGTQRMTYHELNARANQLAYALRARGVGPEVCVGICMERSAALIVGVLGILKAGGAYVPLDPAYPPERLGFMLDDSHATLLLTAGQPQHDEAATSDGLPAGSMAPHFRRSRIDLIGDWTSIATYPTSNPATLTTPHNLAYLIYTSGSTGRPKGVAIEHHSAVVFLAWTQTAFSPEQLGGTLASTSICFDLSVFEIFAPLCVGGSVILAENALALPTLPAANSVTLINTVPSAMAALLRMDGLPASVRTVNLAGEPLPLRLVEQIYATTAVAEVYNLYGPSEDTTYSTYALIPRAATFVPIGRPLANTQAYVLDDQLQQTPIGVSGELYLSGEGLARGYFERPDLTAERFVPNPLMRSMREEASLDHLGSAPPSSRLYKTGDLARYRVDGQLEYLGRIDHQIKVRGFRIELGEVTAALLQYPNVRDAVVVAREDTLDEKYLAAYVVFDPGQPPVVNDLRHHLQGRLPEYMVPSAFVVLDALPLTPNGKVDRTALPAPEGSAGARTDALVAPRTATEAQLVALWREVLGTTDIGVQNNFFALGGHSLLATQLV
ncbi:MAG TPA: amino acid adenylation domain-containing protein, partial [Herpetosiphonaceae bacterium]